MTQAFADRSTPFLVVDESRLRTNIERMAGHAAAHGLTLRPHVKTHKCAQIALMQQVAGAMGITVATIAEAVAFAASGARNIFIAYPMWVDPPRAERLQTLSRQVVLTLAADSTSGVLQMASALPGVAYEVMIEIDSGHHRSGVPPHEAGTIAAAAQAAGLVVEGVFTFPGHAYRIDGRQAAAADEARALGEAAESLRRVGVSPRVISGGSTPSVEYATGEVLTEVRPGVYVFGDAQQWELGTYDRDDLALTAYATVISHAGGRVVLDSGSKTIGADKAPYATGFGRLLDHPDARIVQLSEHHAVVDMAGAPLPELGSRVRVVPNHVCNAVNLVDALHVVGADGTTDRWQLIARGANS